MIADRPCQFQREVSAKESVAEHGGIDPTEPLEGQAAEPALDQISDTQRPGDGGGHDGAGGGEGRELGPPPAGEGEGQSAKRPRRRRGHGSSRPSCNCRTPPTTAATAGSWVTIISMPPDSSMRSTSSRVISAAVWESS